MSAFEFLLIFVGMEVDFQFWVAVYKLATWLAELVLGLTLEYMFWSSEAVFVIDSILKDTKLFGNNWGMILRVIGFLEIQAADFDLDRVRVDTLWDKVVSSRSFLILLRFSISFLLFRLCVC